MLGMETKGRLSQSRRQGLPQAVPEMSRPWTAAASWLNPSSSARSPPAPTPPSQVFPYEASSSAQQVEWCHVHYYGLNLNVPKKLMFRKHVPQYSRIHRWGYDQVLGALTSTVD